MNLLAHAYLSFNEPQVLAGNMISDHVKGKKRYDYPERIRNGISLHREIDDYTDSHPATRELKAFFKPYYGLYSAPISDIIYDHFLANDEEKFPTEESLLRFTRATYSELEKLMEWFPPGFGNIFPYMRQQNWLYNYRFDDGISKSLEGLFRRASYMHDHNEAVKIFLENKAAMRNCYEQFFPGLKQHAIEVLANLKK